MSRPSYSRLAAGLFGLMLLAAAHAHAAQVTSITWKGSDLLVRFSDSVSYKVDLAESDTAQLVIHVAGALAGTAAGSGAADGPNGFQASITQPAPNDLRLTVHGAGRIGYASVWRPYSHTLVVHTFGWDDLGYPQEQYYKGLLALEQGMDTQATELLQVAHSTGDRRAASVLGVYYARRGDFAQAASLLEKPDDADDYAALAAVQAHNGDSAAASASRAQFEKLLADGGGTGPVATAKPARPRPARANGQAVDQSSGDSDNTDNGLETNEMIRERAARKWAYLGAGVVALLLLIGVVVWLSRRSARRPIPPYPPDDAALGRPGPRPPRREAPVAPDLTLHPAEPVAAEQTVEATVTETRQHTVSTEPAANAEPVTVQHVDVEHIPAVPATAPVPAEPVASEPVAAQSVALATEPAVQSPEKIVDVKSAPADHGAVTGASSVEETSGDSGRVDRSAQKQAADLRRRIEAMRTASPTHAPARREPSRAAESTVSEARRLQLSRDSVELRRRLEQKRR